MVDRIAQVGAKGKPAERVADEAVDAALAFLRSGATVDSHLADQLVAIWAREGRVATIAEQHGDPHLRARRIVAQRCLYGVDKNPAAVELAKLFGSDSSRRFVNGVLGTLVSNLDLVPSEYRH